MSARNPSAILLAILLAATVTPFAVADAPYSLTLTRVDPVVSMASPGDVVTIRATLTNTGAGSDTFALALTGDRHYATDLPVASVTLDAGASAEVSYTVTAAAAWYYGEFRLTATSQGDAAATRALISAVLTPVTLTVTANDTRLSPTGQSVTGTVRATHLDGSPYAGAVANVKVEGSLPFDVARTPGSSGSFTTGADGVAYFNFGTSPVDRTPGRHFISAVVLLPGASGVRSNEAFYNILT